MARKVETAARISWPFCSVQYGCLMLHGYLAFDYPWPLLPTLDHNDVVSLASLDLAIFGIACGARLEFVSDLLKVGQEASSRLPAEGTTCCRQLCPELEARLPLTLPRLVFRELAGDIVELSTVAQLGQSLLLLGMLFAENVADVDAGGGLELSGALVARVLAASLAFTLGCHCEAD